MISVDLKLDAMLKGLEFARLMKHCVAVAKGGRLGKQAILAQSSVVLSEERST